MLAGHGLDHRSLAGIGLGARGLCGRGLSGRGLGGRGLYGNGLDGRGLGGRGLSRRGLGGGGLVNPGRRKRLERGVWGGLLGPGLRDGRGLDRGDRLGGQLGLGLGLVLWPWLWLWLWLWERRVVIVELAGGGRLGVGLPGALGAPAFALLTRALAFLRCAFLRLP